MLLINYPSPQCKLVAATARPSQLLEALNKATKEHLSQVVKQLFDQRPPQPQ